MKVKNALIPVVTAAATLATASTAQAAPIEVGAVGSGDTRTPQCVLPDNCFIATKTTVLPRSVAGVNTVYTVPANGRLVAWSVTLAKMPDTAVKNANNKLGRASAQLVVLRKGTKDTSQKVIAATPVRKLDPYFGRTVQFSFSTTIAVRKGDTIGLTVPTWAPVLVRGYTSTTSWRASRPSGKCGTSNDAAKNQTDLFTDTTVEVGKTGSFQCLYTGERLAFTGLLIPTPVPN